MPNPWDFRPLDELMAAVTELLPEATIDQDNDGQLVVYTNLTLITNTDRKDVLLSMGD